MFAKKYFWFTFIEVVVSVTIIALFSIVWISSFERFFKNSQMLWIKTRILNIIKTENNSIIAWEISSYRITFMTGAHSVLINENFFRNPQLIKLDNFDQIGLSWSLETNNTMTWLWNTKTYIDKVLINTYMLSWSWEKIALNFSSLKDFEKIDIISSIDSKETNRFTIKRIDYSWRESWLIEDTYINYLSWTSLYDKVILEDIVWNKKILVSTWTNPESSYSWIININTIRWNQELTFKLEN